MSSRRGNRPTAFEQSFPEEAAALNAERQASSSSGQRGGSGVRPMVPLKRPSEGPDDTRAAKRLQLPPVAYYQPRRDEIEETAEFVVLGEDPDDDEDGEAEKKPIRILTDFTIFDPKHRKEMISLASLESEDSADREFEAAGYVKAYYDGDDADEDEDDDVEGLDVAYVHLSSVLRYTMDFSRAEEPVYIETQFAWYVLDVPSEAYLPYFQYFLTPRRIAQMVISTVMKSPQQDYESFVQMFESTVDPFGRTYSEQDLWDAAGEIQGAIEDTPNPHRMRSTPLIERILSAVPGTTTKRSRPTPSTAPRNRHLPMNMLVGNPDLAVLKAENQNSTHVTSRIAALAQGLIQEELQVLGPPLPVPNKGAIEKQKRRQRDRVCALIAQACKPRKQVQWLKDDRLRAGSQFLGRVLIDGQVYHVGDVILLINAENPFWQAPERYSPADIPLEATIPDFFWFAKILYIRHDTLQAHIQWFEHGSGIMLQELAHRQELFLANLCGQAPCDSIVGKVTVHWRTEPDAVIDEDEFFCKLMHDKDTSTFSTLEAQDTMAPDNIFDPDHCPVCARDAYNKLERECRGTNDTGGCRNGFAYGGHKYHYEDFVRYYGGDNNPASIGYITSFKLVEDSSSEHLGSITCKKVGRIFDLDSILPSKMLRDERQLFLTAEKVTVEIKNLLGVIFAPCLSSLEGRYELRDWLSLSPDHYYVKYAFPTLHPLWSERRQISCEDHGVCTPCWKEKLGELDGMAKYLQDVSRDPLPTLDLFAGVGAFSKGLIDGSKSLKVTHAIEISPSAARTFQRNSPQTIVYNQCANTMLRYTLKTWKGYPTEQPVQLFSEDPRDPTKVPVPPREGEIKVIIAGFPCQAHSSLNMYKKAHDVKNNLMLNAVSWIDLIRPSLVFLENVPGFLSHRLNATQATIYRVEGGVEMGGLKFLVRALIDMGYQVRFGLLQAGNYGTPQGRIRFFLVAALIGTPLPQLPQPSHDFLSTSLEIKLPYGLSREAIHPIRVTRGTAFHRSVTVDDAIGDLPRFDWKLPRSFRDSSSRHRKRLEGTKEVPSLECNTSEPHCGYSGREVEYHFPPRTSFQQEVRAIPTENIQHFTKCLGPRKVERVLSIPLQANADYRSLKPRHQEWQSANPLSHTARRNYKPGMYGRLDKRGFFPTTVTNVDPTAKQSRVLNPYCKRMVSIRELARSQGFADNFVFESIGNSVVTIHRQIGNAVPLPIGRALGRELRAALFQKWKIERENTRIEVDSDSSDEEQNKGDHRDRAVPQAAPSDSDDDMYCSS